MNRKIEKTISVNALPQEVWEYLTNPDLMKEWMGEPEMNIEITARWIAGTPVLIKGFHHVAFENKGMVLKVEPYTLLQYSHVSSISHLPDIPENYSLITFLLTPDENRTQITVQIENFPTESIYKHLDFYWQGTVIVLKTTIEQTVKQSIKY